MHIYAILCTLEKESLKGYDDRKHSTAQKRLAKPCDEQYQHKLKNVLPCFINPVNQSLYTENPHKKVPLGNYKHGEATKKASHGAGDPSQK